MIGQRSVDPQPGTYYRSSRVSSVNGQYFFSTREGTLEGPYRSRYEAERSISNYIERVRMSERLLKHCNEHIDNLYRGTRNKPELND
jgi:hypothetical protein